MPTPRPELSRILLFFLFLVTSTSAIKWLALSRVSSIASVSNEDVCERLYGLISRQIAICKRNIEVMGSVRDGALTAIDECQFQFRTRRWNCSLLQDGRMWRHKLIAGTREAAFVHAVSAAGVAHAVTRACSTGELDKCGCDRSVRGKSNDGFQWSGCSDNVAFGTAFSRAFVDVREIRASTKKSKSSIRALMNLHNNEAGRQILENNVHVECKCHGVSGSCELKTCWRSMPTFRQVGQVLKEKFDGATEVSHRKKGPRRELIPLNPFFKPHTDTDLVYLSNSPDYCEFDPNAGSLGTHGRVCNRTSKSVDGCDLLCCGRGFRTRKERVIERCNCKFQWCCYVKCKKCIREIEISQCL